MNPSVIILDIKFAGYGAVRSLYGKNIKIIAFSPSKRNIAETHSKLIDELIIFEDEKDLYKLLSYYECEAHKPVLILTSDYYVKFIKKYRILSQH